METFIFRSTVIIYILFYFKIFYILGEVHGLRNIFHGPKNSRYESMKMESGKNTFSIAEAIKDIILGLPSTHVTLLYDNFSGIVFLINL